MGEENVELLEQTVKNNQSDIRELKEEVRSLKESNSDLKMNQQLTSQSVSTLIEGMNDLKGSFKALNEKMQQDKEDQLKQQRKTMWQVGATIIAAVVLAQFGM